MANPVEKIVDTIRKNCEKYVAEYNKAFQQKNFDALAEAETNLNGELKRYRKQKADDVVAALAKTENPVKAAIEQLTYGILKTRKTREEGVETGIELVESEVHVDLVKVCEAAGLKTDWQYRVEYLGLVLAMRLANDLNNPAIARAMKTDYRMKDMARKLAEGSTPTSNTQVVKLVQEILDAVLPEAGKVNNHDVKYLEACMSRAGKEAKSVQVGGSRKMHEFFLDMANAIVTESGYRVEYKKAKEKASQPKTEASAA